MLSTPLVSVIIPAYNHERWIAETLESVFNQTLTDFELIVVDDGSKDRTVEIVAGFQDKRLTLVRQKNRGTAAAINRGLNLSRGRYVAILNSDDLFKPERLKVLVELLESRPENMIAFSRVSLIDAAGIELAGAASEYTWLKKAEADYRKSGDLLLSLLRDNFVCTSSNFFFRRRLLVEIGQFRDLRYVNDLDFLIRSLSRFQGIFCPQELLAYRQHGDSTLRERKLDKEADFVLEVAWVLAAAFVAGKLLRQWDFQVLSELLAKYYRLNLETLLLSILCLHSQNRGFCTPGELSEADFAALWQSSRRRLDEQSYAEDLIRQVEEQLNQIEALQEAKTYHIEQSRAWQVASERLQSKNESLREQNGSLRGQNQDLLQKMRARDQELAQAEKLQHEIWQNREWYRQQFETVVNSRRFQFFTILNKIRCGEAVKANLRELLRLLLPDIWRERLRHGRSRLRDLRNPANLKTIVVSRFHDLYRPLFARYRYEQESWPPNSAPLLGLLVLCHGNESSVNYFCQQLQKQTWSRFEVCFLIDKQDCKLKDNLQSFLGQNQLLNWSVLANDNSLPARAVLINQALLQTQTKYIAVLDCNDELAPTFVEEALLKLEASPPHFFLQSFRTIYPHSGESCMLTDNPRAILDQDFSRALVFPRRAAVKLKGFNEIVSGQCLMWEFYVNLIRHGYRGCQINGRIFKSCEMVSATVSEGCQTTFAAGKDQIRTLHLGAFLNKQKWLKKRAQQYWQVSGALKNFPALPSAQREEVFWLNLLETSFVPWQILPLLKEWHKFSQAPLLVTVAVHFKQFFLYNKFSGVRVYFPEEYHLQGKKEYFYSYLEKCYTLRKISPAEIISECVLPVPDPAEKSPARKRTRILYASPWLITGGADTMTVDWFRELDGSWSEKYFMTTLYSENNWLPKIVDYAAGIFDLPLLGCSSLVDVTAFLLDFIARQQIDILHIMNSETVFKALPELKKHFPDLKVVAQFHCFDYFPDGRRTGYPMTMPPRYDHLIDSYNLEYPQLGEEITELYPYIDRAKFKVINGSVDSRWFAPENCNVGGEIVGKRQQNKLNLLFIGRLDRQKQPLRLLEIALELRRDGVAFVMHIVGDGSLESQKPQFLAKIEAENLQDMVCFYGEQSLESMIDWYKIADILLLTSDWEGVPMVLYQAMAMQVVPVVAAVGGCAELVSPDCGYLISDRENPAGYVTAITALADNKRRRKMAKTARKRMLADFSLADLNLKYKDYYRSLLQ